MDYKIRPARPDDHAAIAAFTEATFDWGDYVGQMFDEWLADPDGKVMVASDEEDRPVAMARVTMLSGREAWIQGARVHPDHRRRGVGLALNDAAVAWAREKGGLVARLAVEEGNLPARGQVGKLGYRTVSRWIHAGRELAGARRPSVSPDDRLRLSDPSEMDPSWLAWSASELSQAAHALYPLGWQWRKMTVADVEAAIITRNLWVAPSGWAIVEVDEHSARSPWLVSGPGEFGRLVGALLRHFETRASDLEVMAPDLGWLTEALMGAGCELERVVVYEKQIG